MIFGIIALIAIIGAIFTLVTKNPLGWTLFKAALVLVIITFICGALFFKEKNLRSKGLALLILLVSMVILVLAS